MGVVSRIKSALGLAQRPGNVETRVPYIGDEVTAIVNGNEVQATVQKLETRGEDDWHVHVEERPKVLSKSEVIEVTSPDDRTTLPDHPAFEEPEELPDHPAFEA